MSDNINNVCAKFHKNIRNMVTKTYHFDSHSIWRCEHEFLSSCVVSEWWIFIQSDKHHGWHATNINNKLAQVHDLVQNGTRLTIHEMVEDIRISDCLHRSRKKLLVCFFTVTWMCRESWKLVKKYCSRWWNMVLWLCPPQYLVVLFLVTVVKSM